MTDKRADEAQGRIKEAAGSITGNQDLKDKGKTDQAKASVKDKVDKAASAVKGAFD